MVSYLTFNYLLGVHAMYNAITTSGFNWIAFHKGEEDWEMYRTKLASDRVRVWDWRDGKTILISWFKANINEVLAALKVELQRVNPSTPIYIQWEDADRIKDAAPVFDFAFMFDYNIQVIDDHGIIMGFSSYSMA